jgi:predicted ATP-binding protein involved in virulence
MTIKELTITDFRNIESLQLNLHPQFNLLIGENGSGKTALLEALTVAMGSFFLGIRGADSRHIRDEDIRLFKTIEGSLEFSAYTAIEAIGQVNGSPQLQWCRERNGLSGKTLYRNAGAIKKKSEQIYKALTTPDRTTAIDLPLLVYYSTARLWVEGRENTSDRKTSKVIDPKKIPTRLRGYKNALQAKSSFTIMLEWFKGKFSAARVKGERSFQLDAVCKVIIKNIPNCTNLWWEFDPDKLNTLYVSFENGDELPFAYLSDGYRNLLGIFADLAYRCVTLNPHFGEDAPAKSVGLVLIDELDLHLHPAWQENIVQQLKNTFPLLQFVASSHSPFIIQSMEDGEVLKVFMNEVILINGTNQMGIEDIPSIDKHSLI